MLHPWRPMHHSAVDADVFLRCVLCSVFSAFQFDPRTSDRIVVGSMNRPQRQVEIISGEGKYVARLQSEHLTAVASLNAIHPTLPVMGSCTGSGRLHIWRV